MVSILETVILGIIQGVTEWLPVSSSGHLAIAAKLFGWQPSVIFYVLLHLGTLIVVTTFFQRRILRVLKAFARRDLSSEEGRLGIFIVVGSIPTAIIGYVFQDLFESFFDNLFIIGIALLATGCLLFLSKRGKGSRALDYLDSLLVGTAQGVAIIPGISRSGATISAGLLRGVNGEAAFQFSFLLSIPAVLGATVAEARNLNTLVSGGDLAAVVVGVAVSMVVGYLSLKILRKILLKGRFHWFAPYCWLVGALVIVWQTIGL